MNDFIRIHPRVILPTDAIIGDFVILGHPAAGRAPGADPLMLGAGAIIRSHTVIYAGSTFGDALQTGHHVTVREGVRAGHRVSIGTGSVVEHHVVIGNDVRLHSRVFVPEYSTLEDGCWLGPGVMVTNARYPRSRDVKAQLAGAYIEREAIIGANVTLLPGVRIGTRALVGAGAVVTKDVPPGAVVVGNPARIIRQRDDIPAYAPQEDTPP